LITSILLFYHMGHDLAVEVSRLFD